MASGERPFAFILYRASPAMRPALHTGAHGVGAESTRECVELQVNGEQDPAALANVKKQEIAKYKSRGGVRGLAETSRRDRTRRSLGRRVLRVRLLRGCETRWTAARCRREGEASWERDGKLCSGRTCRKGTFSTVLSSSIHRGHLRAPCHSVPAATRPGGRWLSVTREVLWAMLRLARLSGRSECLTGGICSGFG